ncbi:hypothetical protein F5984_19555 [Rudanella paleaurantiibacter]|uniref:Uncharacterized protein n=1 Tax=Rudanella paleaurantiibacter TaxID=2614655 RepID=A0A7J5TUY5_9BACT|nr:hypothetical protein [Rudanella paleaurantiibacter]KAB7727955.1 hypothetical protein F5984_19555 [Rudanella paleaurantiibacter]
MAIDFKSRKTWLWGAFGLLVYFNMGNDDDSASFGGGDSDVVAEWRTTLAGTRLNYFHTYSSYSGGFSRSQKMDLCPQGTYTFYAEASFDMTGPATEAGTWTVQENGGGVSLVLTPDNGEPTFLPLAFDEKQNILVGNRSYIPAKSGKHGPACY